MWPNSVFHSSKRLNSHISGAFPLDDSGEFVTIRIMTDRRARLTASRPTRGGRWRARLLFIGTLLAVIGGGLAFLWRPPTAVQCVTTQNAYCSPEVEEYFSTLQHTPWLRVEAVFKKQQAAVQAAHDDVVSVTLHRQFWRQIEIEVEFAQPLFTATVGEHRWQVLSNATLKPIEEAPLPLLIFPDQNAVTSLSDEQRLQYAHLVEQLSRFSPRCKLIRVEANSNLTAEFENSGQVLLKMGDNQIIDTQLATLQAFFRSSTMDQAYKVLDLRFNGLAVVKE